MKCLRIIYGLVDPYTHQVRYIGRSSSGLKRPRHHLKKSVLAKDRTHKGSWLRKLATSGLCCTIQVLEEVAGDLAEREVWWIAFGRSQGWPLTNETDGGEGGHSGRKLSEEHKAKISAANKGRQPTEEQRLKMSAAWDTRTISADHLEKLRSARPLRHSEETKLRIGSAHRGKKVSSETRKKLSVLRKKPVVELSTGRTYESAGEAATALGLCSKSVGRVARGEFSQTKGYVFRFLEVPGRDYGILVL